MNTRIRYKKTEDANILVSVKDLTSSVHGAKYKVFINTEDCTYKIKNITSERVYTGGEGVNNLHVLKRNIKGRLESLGVEFIKEIRDNSSRKVGVNCSYKQSTP